MEQSSDLLFGLFWVLFLGITALILFYENDGASGYLSKSPIGKKTKIFILIIVSLPLVYWLGAFSVFFIGAALWIRWAKKRHKNN